MTGLMGVVQRQPASNITKLAAPIHSSHALLATIRTSIHQTITWKSKLFNSFQCISFASIETSAVNTSVEEFVLQLRKKIAASMAPVAKLPFQRWIKPEVYPLFLALGTALSAGALTIARNLTRNPDVKISKEDRGAVMLDNSKEGEAYKNHRLRKLLEGRTP